MRAGILSVLAAAAILAAGVVDGFAGVEVSLVPHDRSKSLGDVRGTVILRSLSIGAQREQKVEERELPFTGTSIRIDEEPGSRWTMVIRASGFWVRQSEIQVPESGTTVVMVVPVWPSTTLRGRLRVPDDGPAVTAVSLMAESPPSPAREPEIPRGTTFDCSVSDDGLVGCQVPVTTLDLAVRVKGYAAVYRWGVELKADAPNDIGTLALRAGASVVAWLDRDSAKRLEGPAIATLTRMVSPEPSQTSARLSAPVAEARFDSRGVAQLASLPPGTYVLTVHAKGFAPARAFPIEVFAGSETTLRKPLVLDRPITVRLAVRPPATPSGSPWQVELRRINDFAPTYDADSVMRNAVDVMGKVEFAEQSPGTFVATVRDESGGVFIRQDLDLRQHGGGETVIVIGSATVRGRALIGEHPLEAELWFGGRNSQVSVMVRSDEEGRFEGVLPRAGKWIVHVAAADPRLDTVVDVDIESGEDLVLRIPDTRAEGVIRDAHGGPLDRVEVHANAAGRIVVVRANKDGTFALRGLPEMPIVFSARDLRTGRVSRPVERTAKAQRPLRDIELWLEVEGALSGRVLSRGTPVVGARVSAIAQMVGSPQARAVSDATGAFQLNLPAAATSAWVVVAAPGRTLQNFDLALDGSPIVLEVEPVGGTLTLAWPAGSFPSLTAPGGPLMIPDLAAWASGHGEQWSGQRVRLPHLAPGTYRLCDMAVRNPPTTGATSQRCRQGMLAPGGTLLLDLGS